MFSSVDIFSGHQNALLIAAIAPLALLLRRAARAGRAAPRHGAARASGGCTRRCVQARGAMTRVRAGLAVFRQPAARRDRGASRSSPPGRCSGSPATCCWSRSASTHQAGLAAAAAVLFAVNITAVLPATPANLGVFQAACAAVLHTGWHVGFGTGVAYGVILQAVEVATAILMGMPALLKEGMSWREVRLRAMHATPVKLPSRPTRSNARRGSRINVEG